MIHTLVTVAWSLVLILSVFTPALILAAFWIWVTDRDPWPYEWAPSFNMDKGEL